MQKTVAITPLGRFWTLDVLRGICAFVVFISHWIFWAQFAPQTETGEVISKILHGATTLFADLFWPRGGNHPAVIGFFVLSGFCIHFSHARDAANGVTVRSWRAYYHRRFLRIMPVYWTAALLGLVVVAAELRHPSGNPLLSVHTESSPAAAVVRLLGLSEFYPTLIAAGNGPLSTVGIELILYAVYPLFYAEAARRRWTRLALFFVGLELTGLVLLPTVSPFRIYNSVLMFGLFWFLGAYVAQYVATRGARPVLRPLLGTWVVFFLLNHAPHFYGLAVLKQDLLGIVCALGIVQLLAIETGGKVQPGLLMRPLRQLGRMSYSLYAVHTPIILLCTRALLRLNHTAYLVQLVVTLGATAAATALVYYGIERAFYVPQGARSNDRVTRAPVVCSTG